MKLEIIRSVVAICSTCYGSLRRVSEGTGRHIVMAPISLINPAILLDMNIVGKEEGRGRLCLLMISICASFSFCVLTIFGLHEFETSIGGAKSDSHTFCQLFHIIEFMDICRLLIR